MNCRRCTYLGAYCIGRFHQGFDEIQCQCFLFIHFCYLCTAGFFFPVHTVINGGSDLPAASVSVSLSVQFLHYPVVSFLFHLRIPVEVEMRRVPVSSPRLSSALLYSHVYVPVDIAYAERDACTT